jgi:hypothetical protein
LQQTNPFSADPTYLNVENLVLVLLGRFLALRASFIKMINGDRMGIFRPHHLQEQGKLSGGVISTMLFL